MPEMVEPNFERLQFFAQRHRPSRMPIAHWHSQIELNYLAEGEMTYLINGRLVPLAARRMGVFWGATPHQVVAQRGESDLVVIYVPLAEFLRIRLPDDFRRRVTSGAFLLDQDSDPADRTLFPRWYEDLQRDSEPFKDLVRHEIVCRLQRMAIAGYELVTGIDVASRPGHVQNDTSLERARQMAVFIAEHFARPLTIEDIARTSGLHPNYAMTLFRRVIGMTIHDYLTRQRLSRAQSMLIDTDMPVASVARASGFGSVSRFYEVFREWVADSPNRYRSEMAKVAQVARYGPGRAEPFR